VEEEVRLRAKVDSRGFLFWIQEVVRGGGSWEEI
jgi:hypothetical protein